MSLTRISSGSFHSSPAVDMEAILTRLPCGWELRRGRLTTDFMVLAIMKAEIMAFDPIWIRFCCR